MAEIGLKTLTELEAKIRQGDHAFVRDFLRNLSRSEIPDRLILNFSQLARRVDYAKKGLLLLRSRVLDLPVTQRPDAREQAEYAACLLKVGAVTEARRLLREVATAKTPEALKFMAFSYVHHWDYAQAIPHLRNYLACASISVYDRMVGSLNLAAALVAVEHFAEAEQLLHPLREQAIREGHRLLLGNICELLAQSQIHQRQFNGAIEYLEESWAALKTAQPRYRLYLQKWQAVSALMQDPADQAAIEKLRQTRVEAMHVSDWETIRDCDLYESLLLHDKAMFLHLYFGTPYEPYRESILRKSRGWMTIPDIYKWGNPQQVLHVESGSLNGRAVVKKGLGRHRLLKALSLDFYAPATVAQLFAQVFEERFHPESSARRIHELIRRLRGDLASCKIKLPLQALKRGYKIDIAGATVAIEVIAERRAVNNLSGAIRSHFGAQEFRLRDLANRLGLPHTTVYRELKRSIHSGAVVVIGTGKETYYALAGPAAKKAG